MAKFRLDSIAALSRQMSFTPTETREAQLVSAEGLLFDIDPTKAYPLDFVIFRITGYRPKSTDPTLLTGLALQHDLGLLIETVSVTLDIRSDRLQQPVLSIDDVTEKFNVTSKTIQRWRRKGLPARRIIFADGKRRVGFLLSSVERFLSVHQEQVVRSANVSQVDSVESNDILRRARRLSTCGVAGDEIIQRIARKTNRSPLTIQHVLRKHEQENSANPIVPDSSTKLTAEDRLAIARRFNRGETLRNIASQHALAKTGVYRIVLEDRIERITQKKVHFIDDPLYHEADAPTSIDAIMAQDELDPSPTKEELRIPRDLPAYLQELYRTPLLSPARERALFLHLNFRKYQFVAARRRLDPQLARTRDLNLLDALFAKIIDARNAIVRANLRLVVSVARKHWRPALNLMELISDGNLTLMRAVDTFDIHRGNRFSTYATFALMKGFARSVPMMLASQAIAIDRDQLHELPDRATSPRLLAMVDRDHLGSLMSRLTQTERTIVQAHYGLGDRTAPATYEQLAALLGLSKHNIRQIERSAMSKLRAAANA